MNLLYYRLYNYNPHFLLNMWPTHAFPEMHDCCFTLQLNTLWGKHFLHSFSYMSSQMPRIGYRQYAMPCTQTEQPSSLAPLALDSGRLWHHSILTLFCCATWEPSQWTILKMLFQHYTDYSMSSTSGWWRRQWWHLLAGCSRILNQRFKVNSIQMGLA